MEKYQRPFTKILQSRLAETVSRIIMLAGPRQVGKTTGVDQILNTRSSQSKAFYAADNAAQPDGQIFNGHLNPYIEANAEITSFAQPGSQAWLIEIWQRARLAAIHWDSLQKIGDGDPQSFLNRSVAVPYVLVIDEIHVIKEWSTIVKGLWDSDRRENLPLHVVILGSSPMLMHKGLTESLAGRFETITASHWSYAEMQTAFGYSLNQYIYFGGYPAPAKQRLIQNHSRWLEYVVSSLIAPNIKKDVLAMARVEKPALLEQLFKLACEYSGQMVGFDKLKGQLDDAGNTTTLTHYLQLLEQAGMIAGLSKYSPHAIRRRASPPKLNVLNTAFQSVYSQLDFEQAQADHSFWGRLVESAIGAHLINTAPVNLNIAYWRESPYEVDFVLHSHSKVCAIEVKSVKKPASHKGLKIFKERFSASSALLVGGSQAALEQALLLPAAEWLKEGAFQ